MSPGPSGAPVRADVAVVGAGPAGAALARACAAEGLEAVVVDPEPGRPWSATYGAWADELEGLGLDAAVGHRWDEVAVVGEHRHDLGRTYVRFDNDRLRGALLGPARLIEGRAASVRHDGPRAVLALSGGGTVTSRLVVDAAGARGALVVRSRTRTRPAVQAALGIIVTEPAVRPVAPCVLMDWRAAPGADLRDPTFLYAMDLGFGRWLVEETSLARRPALDEHTLRWRLGQRLGLDLRPGTDADPLERVHIPMGGVLPTFGQPVVAFGAAAGYVHPATGYSVGASLRAAPRVAAAIAEAVRSDADAAEVGSRVWPAVWPVEQRRVRALHDVGLAALLRLDQPGLQAFFDAFFELDPRVWSAYLRLDATAAEVSQVMWEVLRRVPWRVRARLAIPDPRLLAAWRATR